jgi:type IV pilus assembly protein PilQ
MHIGKYIVLLSVAVCGLVSNLNGTGTQSLPGASGQSEKVIDFFDVYNADLRSVFKQLSEYSGVDIVAADNVKGSVTISVTKKTWFEILTIVCKISNLTLSNEGNYVYVLTTEDYLKRQTADAASVDATQNLSPLKREIIKINHSPVNEIKESVVGLLSPKGKVTIVEHNNSLIIFDTEQNIEQIRNVIATFDVETAQISISCKIIEVSSGAAQRMGVHWGYFNRGVGVEASHIQSNTGIIAGALDRLSYGIINQDNLSVALEYLFSDAKGEVVAQPQITTLDNKEAKIFMGQQIPVTRLDEAGNTVVTYVNAGTQMTVKPHLSGEGRILLELNPKKESYQLQEGVPVINEQSAQTSVVVSNGETVVIAGLTSNEKHEEEDGIPFLKNIPFIGHLFKKSNKSLDKKDLIIFVTPHIIQKDMTPAAPAESTTVDKK